jgi:hypothetical protein
MPGYPSSELCGSSVKYICIRCERCVQTQRRGGSGSIGGYSSYKLQRRLQSTILAWISTGGGSTKSSAGGGNGGRNGSGGVGRFVLTATRCPCCFSGLSLWLSGRLVRAVYRCEFWRMRHPENPTSPKIINHVPARDPPSLRLINDAPTSLLFAPPRSTGFP